MQASLTEKQRIERDAFNRIAREKTHGRSLIVGKEKPSFADYNGDVFFGAVRFMNIPKQRILEIGCGSGEISIWFALHGARRVLGVDISEESIHIAQQRKHEHGIGEHVQFIACPGENIHEPDGSFDNIFINVALHHLEIKPAIIECYRLLAPGGQLIAIEPLARSSFAQRIRESTVIQKLYPIRRETTAEKILSMNDIAFINSTFGNCTLKPYRMLSPFIYKAKPLFEILSRVLFHREREHEIRKQKCNQMFQQLDNAILRAFPLLAFASRYSVILAQKSPGHSPCDTKYT